MQDKLIFTMKELVDIITPLLVDVQMYKCVWLFENVYLFGCTES